jgi:hypothetical protein
MTDPAEPRSARTPLSPAARALRLQRIFARLQEGRSYKDIAAEEGLSRERLRRIVEAATARGRTAAWLDHKQFAGLEPASRLAARGVAEGDVRPCRRARPVRSHDPPITRLLAVTSGARSLGAARTQQAGCSGRPEMSSKRIEKLRFGNGNGAPRPFAGRTLEDGETQRFVRARAGLDPDLARKAAARTQQAGRSGRPEMSLQRIEKMRFGHGMAAL